MNEVVDVTSDRDALRGAISDLQRARRQLDVHGEAAIGTARVQLERAIVRLEPVTTDNELPLDIRRAAERCRATLSSHLVAAENLEAVGVAPEQVTSILRRATTTDELEAAVDDRGLHYVRH
jgi:uncharacterized protein (UPF0147 family)